MGMRQHSGPIPAKPILHFSSDMLKRVGTPGTPSPVGNSNKATLKFKKNGSKMIKKNSPSLCCAPGPAVMLPCWSHPAAPMASSCVHLTRLRLVVSIDEAT